MSDGNFNNPGSANPADQAFGQGVPVQQPPPGGPLPNMGGFSTPGAPGAPGSVWYEGAGAPASGLGIAGDFYLNTSNGSVYQKTGSGWGAPVANLKGPLGPSGPPGPIADVATIYWANQPDGTIMRQSPGNAPMVFASGQNGPAGVSCDGVNVYWVNQGNGTIMRLSVAGGVPTIFASGQNGPFVVSSDGVNVYWTNDGDSTIMQLSVAGGVPTIFASGQITPRGICSDGVNVYWAKDSDNTIMRLGVGGGAPAIFASGQNLPTGVFSDGVNVYWASWNDGTITRLPVGGGTPTVIASGQNSVVGVCSDGTYVYWTSWADDTITRLSVGGGTPTIIASGQNGPQGIATNLRGPPGPPGPPGPQGPAISYINPLPGGDAVAFDIPIGAPNSSFKIFIQTAINGSLAGGIGTTLNPRINGVAIPPGPGVNYDSGCVDIFGLTGLVNPWEVFSEGTLSYGNNGNPGGGGGVHSGDIFDIVAECHFPTNAALPRVIRFESFIVRKDILGNLTCALNRLVLPIPAGTVIASLGIEITSTAPNLLLLDSTKSLYAIMVNGY